MKDFVLNAFADSANVKQQFAREHADRIVQVAALLAAAFREGHKVLLFGNGGSATDAAHIAAEFVGRYKRERMPLAAIALATSGDFRSDTTAWATAKASSICSLATRNRRSCACSRG